MAVQDAQETATGGRTSASRAAALLTVCEFPGTHIVQLARILGLTHSATVRIVDALTAEGLIARSPAGGDARRVSLRATAEGERRGSEIQSARTEALTQLLRPLTQGQREELAAILDTMLGGKPHLREEACHICRFCAHSACSGPDCPVGRSVEASGGESEEG